MLDADDVQALLTVAEGYIAETDAFAGRLQRAIAKLQRRRNTLRRKRARLTIAPTKETHPWRTSNAP